MNRAFFLTMGMFVLVFGIFGISKTFSNNTKSQANIYQSQEIKDIDSKITELEEMKRGYEARAIKHKNQAQRLQFVNGELQTAKRHWQLAEENTRIATRIQHQIDDLKVQRQDLISKYHKRISYYS